MNTKDRITLTKHFHNHIKTVSMTKRSLRYAELYYFHHPNDHAEYSRRIRKVKRTIATSMSGFNALARTTITSRVRVSWEGERCCVVRHKIKGYISPEVLVLGTPSKNSLAEAMKHQQNKDKLAAPLKVKLREIEQRIIATAADYQQCMLDYQRLTQEIQALRDSMTRHRNAAGGLAALNPDDLAIVGQTRELAKQAHILSIYIPRKRVKLDNLHARRDALNNKRAVL